jgi:uncharacterized protein YraI
LKIQLLGLTWLLVTFAIMLKAVWVMELHGTVIQQGATTVRSGPLIEAAELASIPEGTAVVIKDIYKDWAHITFGDQPAGWVKTSDLFITRPSGTNHL